VLAVAYALPVFPLAVMVPETGGAMRVRAWPELGLYADDVLGTGIFLIFLGMLAVTPLVTVTGQRWFTRLRWYYGVCAALTAVAALGIIIVVPATGGMSGKLAGNVITFTGTMAILAFIPLGLTASSAAQRWLGRYWKPLHRIVFGIWALLLFHVWLIMGLHGVFLNFAAMSLPLVILRIPVVRRWWNAQRKALHIRASQLWAAGIPLALIFAWGLAGPVMDEARMGWLALTAQQIHV